MLRLNFHFKALFKVISLISLVIFSSCSSAPKVNKNWLAQNCSAPADFKPDKCIAWSNCKTVSETLCACTYENGTYHGQLLDGKHHGLGSFSWNDKTVYAGYWHKNKKNCGVEAKGNEFFVFKNGIITDRNSSTSWADAFAGALMLGTAGYLAGQSGYAGYYSPTYDYDWDWDYQPGNNQWVCRGIQTGQYAELENCTYDYKDDDRWP